MRLMFSVCILHELYHICYPFHLAMATSLRRYFTVCHGGKCSLHANAFSSTVNSSVIIIKMSRCCTGFYSNVLSQLPAVAERRILVIMHDDICCCCKVKGNGEKKKAAWRLTLVTTSVLAPARQRWRTTSRLPLLAARCRGVLPYWIKERNIWKRSFQSTPDDMWQYWTWWILTSKI